jgi:hypothetical protein
LPPRIGGALLTSSKIDRGELAENLGQPLYPFFFRTILVELIAAIKCCDNLLYLKTKNLKFLKIIFLVLKSC